MNLQTNKPALVGKASLNNCYVSTCKICLGGIYEPQKRVWSRRPLGLCHQSCVERAS